MATITLKDKAGNILDNNEIVYLNSDIEKKFPIKRIVRYALRSTNKTMNVDCDGCEGEGEWGVDTFWNYFNEFYPELINDIPTDSNFEDLLVETFNL